MARTRTATPGKVANVKNDGPAIHHMVRTLSPIPSEDGSLTVDALDAVCDTWLEAGYKVAAVKILDVIKPGGPQANAVAQGFRVDILYIFVRDK